MLAEGTYAFSDTMCSRSALCITRALVLEAVVPGSVILDALNSGGSTPRRVVYIETSSAADVVGLVGLVITRGGGSVNGGGINCYRGTLNVDSCEIHSNSGSMGGGIAIDGAMPVTVTSSIVRNNVANGRAGAIWQSDGILTILSTQIRANTAQGGGGIFAYAGQLILQHSTFVDNNDQAGAAYASCALRIANTVFSSSGSPPPPPLLYNNSFLRGEVPCDSAVMINILKTVDYQCDLGQYMTPTPFWPALTKHAARSALSSLTP